LRVINYEHLIQTLDVNEGIGRRRRGRRGDRQQLITARLNQIMLASAPAAGQTAIDAAQRQ
jgi:hypothetical protein